MTRSSARASGQLDVAGAGLDDQRAVEGVEPAVAGAALDLAVAERAVEGDVGAAGLDDRVAVGREADRDGVRLLAAEEPAAAVALGADHADLAAVLTDLDALGVAALDLDGGGGGVAGGDLDLPLPISTYRSTGSWVSNS